MRTEKSHETEAAIGPEASASMSSASARRRWVKPALRVRPLPEVVRGAAGSAPDTFGQSANLPGG